MRLVGKPKTPYIPPFSSRTMVSKEFEVIRGRDVFLRGQAEEVIVNAHGEELCRTWSIILAEEIIQMLNRKYPMKRKGKKP